MPCLPVVCACALWVDVNIDVQWEWTFPLCVCVCCVLLRQLADLACHTCLSTVNTSLKMIDSGGLFLMNWGLFVCGVQGNGRRYAPIVSATYGETP